jgi:hypothetical protein
MARKYVSKKKVVHKEITEEVLKKINEICAAEPSIILRAAKLNKFLEDK